MVGGTWDRSLRRALPHETMLSPEARCGGPPRPAAPDPMPGPPAALTQCRFVL